MKNNLSSNQLTIVIVEKIPEENKPEVFVIPDIPEEQVELEKGYYHFAYVMLRFKKEVGFESKEEQVYVEDDPNEEDMDYVNLDDDRELHCMMVFEDNNVGVDDAKSLLYTKLWFVYVN